MFPCHELFLARASASFYLRVNSVFYLDKVASLGKAEN